MQDEWLGKLVDQMHGRFDKLEEKVDKLNSFRLKIVGASLVISLLGSALFQAALAAFH